MIFQVGRRPARRPTTRKEEKDERRGPLEAARNLPATNIPIARWKSQPLPGGCCYYITNQ